MKIFLIVTTSLIFLNCTAQESLVNSYFKRYDRASIITKYCFVDSLHVSSMKPKLNDSLLKRLSFKTNLYDINIKHLGEKEIWQIPNSLCNEKFVLISSYLSHLPNFYFKKSLPTKEICTEIESILIYEHFLLVQTKNGFGTNLNLFFEGEQGKLKLLEFISDSIIPDE